MTSADVVHRYLIGMVVALIVVILAATLVLRIVGLARGALAAVVRSRRAVSAIEVNVGVIPQLATAAGLADRILEGALDIEAKVHLVADHLEARHASASLGGR